MLSIFLVFLTSAEAERRKREEAERKAKLDEIAEKQRQRERELEEKERLRRQQLLASEPPARPSEPFARPHPEAAPAASASASASAAAPATTPAPGKYVPRHLRERAAAESPATGQALPSEPDRWGRRDDRDRPAGDKWRSDDRRSFGDDRRGFGGGERSRSTWSSSRGPPRGS